MKDILESWMNFMEEKEKLRAAMVVVLNNDQEVLLLKRSAESNWMPKKWALPGGHIEKGESSKDAAVREAKEEANIVLKDIDELKKETKL